MAAANSDVRSQWPDPGRARATGDGPAEALTETVEFYRGIWRDTQQAQNEWPLFRVSDVSPQH